MTIWSILEPPKIKSDNVSTVYPSICHKVMRPDAMILVFWMLSFKPTLSLSSFTFIKRLFKFFFAFCHKGGVISLTEVIDISPSNLDSSLCFIQSSISGSRTQIKGGAKWKPQWCQQTQWCPTEIVDSSTGRVYSCTAWYGHQDPQMDLKQKLIKI